MKRIAIGLIALTITYNSIAQEINKSRGEKKEFHKDHRRFDMNNGFEKLNLSQNQKDQIKSLNQEFRDQLKSLNQIGSITVDEQRTRRKQLAQNHHEKVLALLTPDQKKQAETLKGESGVRGKGRLNRFESIAGNLKLSPAQTEKAIALRSELRNNIKNIKQDSKLDEIEKKEQIKSLVKKQRAEFESVLTPEQKEQLKNHHKNRSNGGAVK